MTTKLAQGQIKRIADHIGVIGDDFEAFGQIVMNHFTPIRLTHPGLNELGFPVGYAVDTADPDGKFVAQYSAEKNYFYKGMPKAKKDLTQALNKEPAAEIIYLLSSNRLKNAPVRAFRKAAYQDSNMKRRKLRVWGAVEIAAVVREFLFNDLAVEELAPYLPALRKIRDEEAATLEVPEPDKRHVDLREVDGELERRLNRSRCVTLAGIPGSGKSATAKSYAARHKKAYQLVIWLDGSRVGTVKALNAVPITRGGENRNVSFLLRTQPCLLVLDDVEASLDSEALGALCGPESRILITRRKPTSNAYVLPSVSKAASRRILNRDAPQSCPEEVFSKIWQTIGGHPLTLGLINADARNGTGWNKIARDCDAIGEFDHGGVRLADYLLGRIRQLVTNELSVFQWAGQPQCDQSFLEEVVNPQGVRKLKGNGLTAADRPGIVRLHDIIFAALGGDRVGPVRNAELNTALETYLERVSQQNTLDFWNTAKLLRPKLDALARAGDQRPAYLYSLLQIWTTAEFDRNLLVDPAIAAAKLTSGTANRTAIAAIIETIEREYLHDRQTGGEHAAKASLSARLSIFDTLANLPGLDGSQTAQIEHHKGKALARSGKRDDATALFETLLTQTYVLPETKLQLIRLRRKNPEQAGRVAVWSRELLDGERKGSVGRSLALAVIESLPWGDDGWRRDLISEYEDQIEKTIVTAAEAGMPQAYRALASIGRYWARHDPGPLQRVFRKVPPWAVEGDLDDDDKGAYAELLMAMASLDGEEQAARHEEAEAFFEAIIAPSAYQQQRHAELLLDMGRAEHAGRRLKTHPELSTSAFVKRLMARARLALDDAAGALIWIDAALACLDVERFRSEFLALRYRIRAELNDPAAADDLRRAHAGAAPGRERDRLSEELARLTAQKDG